MMRTFQFLFFLLISVTLIHCSGEQTEPPAPSEERPLEFRETVHILSDRGDTLSSMRVAIADTDERRQAGLMNVQTLPEDHGMLFIFDRQEPLSFWMANTPLALDILFADSTGVIVRIHRHTQPYSDRSLGSEKPALYALETVAGYAMAHDIQEGSRIVMD